MANDFNLITGTSNNDLPAYVIQLVKKTALPLVFLRIISR